jgi:hypothetical protein
MVDIEGFQPSPANTLTRLENTYVPYIPDPHGYPAKLPLTTKGLTRRGLND